MFLNNLIPDIKITLQCDENSVHFLHTTIFRANNTLQATT
jgi:hypothetical protein